MLTSVFHAFGLVVLLAVAGGFLALCAVDWFDRRAFEAWRREMEENNWEDER